jgi:hypothetical protein
MTSILLGIVGPLLVVSLSWAAMARTFRRDPSRLTSLMMIAFAAKMVFFAAYIALAMTVFAVSPVPFVTSFVVSFVALYSVEAVLLRRMMAGGSA